MFKHRTTSFLIVLFILNSIKCLIQTEIFESMSNQQFISIDQCLINTIKITNRLNCLIICTKGPSCVAALINKDFNECKLYSCLQIDFTRSSNDLGNFYTKKSYTMPTCSFNCKPKRIIFSIYN